MITKKEKRERNRREEQMRCFIGKIPYREMLVLGFSTDNDSNLLCTQVEKRKVFMDMLYQNYEYLDQIENIEVLKDKISSCNYSSQLCKGIIVGSWMGYGRNMGRTAFLLDILLNNYDQHGHINAVLS